MFTIPCTRHQATFAPLFAAHLASDLVLQLSPALGLARLHLHICVPAAHIKASSGAYKYFCNGQWLESSSGKTVPVTNPSTLQKDYQVQACTQEEVNNVFAAAKAAQLSWAKTPLWKRAEYLHKVAVLMRQNAQPMADCLVKEIAKPAKDALTGACSSSAAAAGCCCLHHRCLVYHERDGITRERCLEQQQ